MMFANISLSSGKQTIIWTKIIRAIYCLRNEYEQIYLFVNISTRNSYQLTEMSASLRNCTFFEISDPGVECFAPCFGTANGYYLISGSLHLWCRSILRFSKFYNLSFSMKYFCKSFAIFRSRNKYLNKGWGRYLLPPKWLWTDFFDREYF